MESEERVKQAASDAIVLLTSAVHNREESDELSDVFFEDLRSILVDRDFNSIAGILVQLSGYASTFLDIAARDRGLTADEMLRQIALGTADELYGEQDS